ncbi:hypothetical protein IQ22_03269 [Pseudomonas duriflava]|uniref:Uncharacterized protein n=1 Tax=Pseudomonas duriflava TaxID=459528 RepID=A0A562Q6Y7_9PSED|nr:hypothetical protein [Pseudomonas duriflava]TWI52499.1 hypothetical protein IQ22_03269 [Pseudomonas duriflava]
MEFQWLFRELQVDPNDNDWVKGWGVFRNSPWHFVAMFNSESVADSEAIRLGGDYIVSWGAHKLGTNQFIVTEKFDS